MNLSVKIPDGKAKEIIEIAARELGYQPEIPDPEKPGETMKNPTSAKDFVNDALVNFLTSLVRSGQRTAAVMESEKAAAALVEGVE